MYYDALTLACVKDELASKLLGGRVQRVLQPSKLSIGLEIYARQRHQLLLSADPRAAGVMLVEEKPRRGVEAPSPLLLLLRKYVRGARLVSLAQPPFERVLRLTFGGEQGTATVICEIMGRYSNIILLGTEGPILDAIKRVPSTINRYRTTLPQQPYVAPPPQDKENPLLLTPNVLRQATEGPVDQPIWRRIVQAVAGISPLLAREIVYRACGQTEPGGELRPEAYVRLVEVIEELMSLPENHRWSPCVAAGCTPSASSLGESRRAVAYAPYALTHLDYEPVESISAAIALVAESAGGADAYRQVRERLYRLIDEQIERQEARLAALRRSLVTAAEIDELELRGNVILAMAWSVKPGQTELVVNAADFGADRSGELRIPLDPSLSPAQDAQALFEQYRKNKSATEEVPKRMREAEAELTYLAQLRTDTAMAENRPQLDQVEQALQEAGLGPKRKTRPTAGRAEPINRRAPDGTLILVGRNSRQNDLVTFRQSSPDDLWLHARGVPGSHVIIRSDGADVAEETLTLAARLAAYYSAARGEAQVQVDYTPRRHVRHIRGARPGMVTYQQEKSLVVCGRAPSEDEMGRGPLDRM